MTTNKDFMQVAEAMTSDKMLGLCEVILTHGLAISGGCIVMRDNETMQDLAQTVANFPADQLDVRLHKPTGNPVDDRAAVLVDLCHTYYGLSEAQNAEYGHVYIERMAQIANDMVRVGWSVTANPVNYDVDSANNKLAGYKEPTGVAAEFAHAFNIEYKKPKLKALAVAECSL